MFLPGANEGVESEHASPNKYFTRMTHMQTSSSPNKSIISPYHNEQSISSNDVNADLD